MKMKSRTKWLTLTAIILSVVLILTIVLYETQALKGGASDKGAILLGIIVASVAVLSVVFVFYMRKKKQKMYAILSAPYRDLLDDIMISISASNMGSLHKKQIEEELLDLFVSAYADGKKVEEVIGDDKEHFIEEITVAYGAKNNFLTYELSGLQYFIIYLLLAQFSDFIRNGSNSVSFFDTVTDFSTITLFGLLSFVTIPLVMFAYHKAVRSDRFSLAIAGFVAMPVLSFVLFIGFNEVIIRYFSQTAFGKIFLQEGVVVYANYILIVLGIILLGAAMLLKRMIQKKNLRKDLYG